MDAADLVKGLQELLIHKDLSALTSVQVLDEDGISHDIVEIDFDETEGVIFLKAEAN